MNPIERIQAIVAAVRRDVPEARIEGAMSGPLVIEQTGDGAVAAGRFGIEIPVGPGGTTDDAVMASFYRALEAAYPDAATAVVPIIRLEEGRATAFFMLPGA